MAKKKHSEEVSEVANEAQEVNELVSEVAKTKLTPKRAILVPDNLENGVPTSWVRVQPHEWDEVFQDALFSFWDSIPEINKDKLIAEFFNKA
jgi:hypothetical protein